MWIDVSKVNFMLSQIYPEDASRYMLKAILQLECMFMCLKHLRFTLKYVCLTKAIIASLSQYPHVYAELNPLNFFIWMY